MPSIVSKTIMYLVQISWCLEKTLIYWIPENKPTGLENVTTSELVANNLNAIFDCRNAFVETEASEKLKRAFLRKAWIFNLGTRYISKGEMQIDGEILVK